MKNKWWLLIGGVFFTIYAVIDGIRNTPIAMSEIEVLFAIFCFILFFAFRD